MSKLESVEKLYEVLLRLRAPDGCPWDREQSPYSLRGNLLEEVYEAIEAIEEGASLHAKEELGDVIFVAMMIASIYEEKGEFKLEELFSETADKLIRRHPHVFGQAKVENSEEVLVQWQNIKEKQEGRAKKDSIIDEVKKCFPPLERAYKIQKKVAKVGFDWNETSPAWDKLNEEIAEAREAEKNYCNVPSDENKAKLEDEIGDILFSAVNVARKNKVDPSLAILHAVEKFSARFRYVEKKMKEAGQSMEEGKLELMDSFWDEYKKTH